MKGANFSCASPASAAVCTSIDRRSMVRPTIVGKKRHSHFSKPSSIPHDPFTSKTRKSSLHRSTTNTTITNTSTSSDLISPANSSRYLLHDKAFFDVCSQSEPVKSLVLFENSKRISTSTHHEDWDRSLVPANSPRLSSSTSISNKRTHGEKKIWDQSLVPVDSRRHVLRPLEGDKSLVPVDSRRNVLRPLEGDKSVMKSSSPTRSHHQVVVLRVSLHCKGCEGKVRKHISKMEGVTSFNIDLSTKKVTVVGDVTPLGVLNSVSKVKSAQFWPSPPRASASF